MTAAARGFHCCLLGSPSLPGLYLQKKDSHRLQFCMFPVLFLGGSCRFGFVSPEVEVEGNVFCLALNPCFVFPQVLIVCLTKNLGKEEKVGLHL